MNRLNKRYTEEVVPSLMKKFNYKSVMEVPAVEKLVINMGIRSEEHTSALQSH